MGKEEVGEKSPLPFPILLLIQMGTGGGVPLGM